MTKDEALDLALEALIYASSYCDTYDAIDAITAIKQARALDKMAENARELGLDYEPAQQYSATSDHRLMENAQGELERIKLVQTGVGIGKPEQEPVAYLVDGDLYYPEEIDWETLQEQGHTVAPLYTKDRL